MPNAFQAIIVTPTQQLLEEEHATQVVFTAHDGQVGILDKRAPLLTRLGFGPCKITTESGQESTFFVAAGFAQMKGNTLTILADDAIKPADLDTDEARKQLDAAIATVATTEPEQRTRENTINRNRAILAMADA